MLLDAGRIYFEYDETFKGLGLEISSMKLPLHSTRLYSNSDDVAYYEGLAGVFMDSAPQQVWLESQELEVNKESIERITKAHLLKM